MKFLILVLKRIGVGVGPGELGMSFFFKDTACSNAKGDVLLIDHVLNKDTNKVEDVENLCEVKASGGRIPDIWPAAFQCRNAAVEAIKRLIAENNEILINKELMDCFTNDNWLVVYNKTNYITTINNIKTQFLTHNNASLKYNKKDINIGEAVRIILTSMFSMYGSMAHEISNNLDKIVKDDGNIDNLMLKKYTIISILNYYKRKEGFSALAFYSKKSKAFCKVEMKEELSYAKTDDLINKIMKFILWPNYGASEDTTRTGTSLVVKP